MFEEHQKQFIKYMQTTGDLILVEGKNDRKVLEKMGLENIFEISGKQLDTVADILKTRQQKVIILTDYDKEGIRQYKRLKSLLLANDIKINDSIRRDFKRNFLVNKIEDLSSYFR